MINRIYDYMLHNRMIEPGSRIVAAVSGGADSMCLLEVLRKLQPGAGFSLRVVHVHHGLRRSADEDLLYVSKFCEEAGIPFEAARVDAAGYAAEKGLSIEEAARLLRYEALEEAAERWDREAEVAGEEASERRDKEAEAAGEEAAEQRHGEETSEKKQPGCRIAVAHHIEDQAETVLFNLVRGSRLTGLRGMLPVNGRIIRPLLMCSRAQIEEFLREKGISWREDETNEDIRYARNLLRREVMPLLKQVNSGAVEHIAKAATEAAEAEELLRNETDRALAACCRVQTGGKAQQDPCCILSVPELMREEPLIRRRVVYAVIAKTAGRKKDLQVVHVQAVLQLAEKNGNGRLDVHGGVRVEKLYDKLLFSAGGAERAGGHGQGNSRARSIQLPAAETAVPGSIRATEAAGFRRWPMEAGEYSCRVFDFDGDLSAVPRKQCTKWLDYDKIGAFPSFRTRREGDRITLDESGKSKSIARYMIDTKVPAELRGRIVLPAAGSEILWIPAAAADPTQQTEEQRAETQHKATQRAETQKTETHRSSDIGRISAAYKVSSQTRRILEIRWNPSRTR